MRSLLDLRFSRLSLIVLATVSALATVLILHGANDHTPAQMAALTALHEKPAARQPATVVVQRPAPTPTTVASRGSSGAAASSGGGASAPVPSTPAPSAPVVTPAPAAPVTPAAPAPDPASPATSTDPSTQTSATSTPDPDSNLPKVGHVFEISLSAPSFAKAFGAHSQLPYLRSLARQGTVLSGYHSLGAGELADELALVGGQAPNPDTAKGCPTYAEFPTGAVANKAGLVPGRGCIYPDTALTIGDQVTAGGKVWGAYAQDMGSESCVHANSGALDDITLPFSHADYDPRHNPFIYFHSLLDLGDCSNDDVDLSHLPKALHSASATPEFSYIAPNACADGDPTMLPSPATTTSTSTTSTSTSTTPTTASTTTPTTASSSTTTSSTSASASTTSTSASSTTTTTSSSTTPTTATTPAAAPAGCSPKAPSGPSAENAFLKTWIPHVLHSAAYRKDGVLVIAIASSNKPTGHPAQTGALVLSRWTPRGHTLAAASGPYALLRFTEDALRLDPLAHASTAPALAAQLLGAS
jgi:hypothetical protein